MVEVQSDPRLSVFTDRGYIYDKDGRLLARNKSAGSLYAYRKNIPNKYNFFKALEENRFIYMDCKTDRFRKSRKTCG